MLSALAAFEWRTQTRQVAFVVAALLFFGAGALVALTGFGPGNVAINSPYSIAESLCLLSLFSVFVIATFCAGAMVRDREHRMEALVFTTAVGKRDFLFGRFAGSFAAAVTVVACALPGMIAGALLRGNADGRRGAFQLLAYLWPFVALVLPSMLFAGALIFAVAALTRSALASHLVAVFLYVLYFVAAALTNSPLMAASSAAGQRTGSLGAVLDPFGLSAFFELTRYWPPAMRNARLLPLAGPLLENRALVVAFAAAVLVFVYRRFAFRVLLGGSGGAPEPMPPVAGGVAYRPIDAKPRLWPAFLAQARSELRGLLTSVPFLLVVLLWLALAVTEILGALGAEHGSRLMAATPIVLGALVQPLQLMSLITLIYFGMETVWRERASAIAGIINATPAASGALVLAKWLALSAMVGILLAGGLVVALVVQLASGMTPELGHYLWFAWIRGLPLALFAGLTVFVHVASRRKYAGMLVVIVAAVLLAAGGSLSIPHHLWRFAATPPVQWSDMNGLSPHLLPFHAFTLHWSLLAALCLVLAAAGWRAPSPWQLLARKSPARRLAAFLALAAIGTGSVIVYSTTVLNRHESRAARARWKADYERKYRSYAQLPQPRIHRLDGEVALYPSQQRARLRGRYLLVNETARPIARVLVSVPRDARKIALSLSGARQSEQDARFGEYWFELARPLAPGEHAELSFDLTFARRGFEDSGPDVSVVANGSYLTGLRALPTLGYRASYELTDAAERRELGLPAREDFLSVGGEAVANDWLAFELTVSTEEGQTAVSSGTLVDRWTQDGRAYFHYRSEAPVPDALAFASARYEVARASHHGIPVEVYFHPAHQANVARMLKAATESLGVFEGAFGPYRFAALRLVEVPSYWPFGGFASPGMVALPEDRSFLTRPADPGQVDLVYRRIAHEVAHQWWGHGVSPANQPGGAMIVETLAKYGEQLALEHAFGAAPVRENAAFELDHYLRGRADQVGAEPPLSRVRDEAHLYYGKGTVVMSGLRALLGEQRLDAALTAFLAAQSGPGKAATTGDLLASLEAVARPGERELIASWLEKVILYDLELESGEVHERSDGRFDVALRIRASRAEVSGDAQVPLPLDETVAVELRDDQGVLQTVQAPLRTGENELRAVTAAPPTTAILDPDFTRVDTNRANNLTPLHLQSRQVVGSAQLAP